MRMPPGDRQRGAERAEVAAIEALDEQAGREQAHGKGDEGPVARELEDDRGLEGLDLGQPLGELQGIERQAEQDEKDHVLDRPQPLVQPPGTA